MKVTVSAKPHSKKESLVVNEDGSLTIKVNAVPEDGKANRRIIELLSEYYGVPRSKIELKSGLTSKKKIFEIKD